MHGLLLIVSVVAGLLGWAFFSISNLPIPVPPRWTFEDQLQYRWYDFISKLGFGFRLSPEAERMFLRYILQGIDYAGDYAEYEYCQRNKCSPGSAERLCLKMDNWQTIDPPR